MTEKSLLEIEAQNLVVSIDGSRSIDASSIALMSLAISAKRLADFFIVPHYELKETGSEGQLSMFDLFKEPSGIAVYNRDGLIKPLLDLETQVRVDGGKDIIARIIGVAVYNYDIQYQCAWWNNGEHKEDWFSASRVQRVDGA